MGPKSEDSMGAAHFDTWAEDQTVESLGEYAG